MVSLSQQALSTLHSCGHYYQTDVQGCVLYFDAQQDSFVLPDNFLKYITGLMFKDLLASGQEQVFAQRLKPWPQTGGYQ